MQSAIFLWQIAINVGAVIPDDEKWTLIRTHRTRLLTESDWSQLADAPFTAEEKNTWTAYRQTLRDIPQDYTSPDDAMFPDPPSIEVIA